MSTRTTHRTVTFTRPFRLAEVNDELPAGDYVVETDEEAIDGVSFLAWRRVGTFMYLPSPTRNGTLTRTVMIDAAGLEDVLRQDSRPPKAEGLVAITEMVR